MATLIKPSVLSAMRYAEGLFTIAPGNTIATANNQVKQLVKANPARICIIFSTGGVSSQRLVWGDSSVAATKGLELSTVGGLLTIDFNTYPGLPNQEWWAFFASIGSAISWYEINLTGQEG